MDTVFFLIVLTEAFMLVLSEKTERVEENDSKVLSCPTGKILKILYATYTGNAFFCKENDVTSIVQSRCQWKFTCTLQAFDDVYGDTCMGPDEYLVIRYDCQDDCLYNVNGQVFYNGTRSFTVSGTECQRWDSDEPHVPKYRPIGRRHKNYCRNPDNDQKAWCYTTDPDVRWEYCDIQQCATTRTTVVPTQAILVVTGAPTQEDDTPVAIILGVLFGLLVASIILVAVILLIKRRGMLNSEPDTTDQRNTYLYAAPENDGSLMSRVRNLVRWNRKGGSCDAGNVLANNPGYSAMNGERIEPVDYANAPIVKARVYEIPNTDHNRPTYTSLYDTPNRYNANQISNTGNSYENQNGISVMENTETFIENEYEIAQVDVKQSNQAFTPILKKPKPSPKPPHKSSPKPDILVGHSDAPVVFGKTISDSPSEQHFVDKRSINTKDICKPEAETSPIQDGHAKLTSDPNKQSDSTIKESSSVANLVKQFNKS